MDVFWWWPVFMLLMVFSDHQTFLTVTANSILGKYDHIWPHKRLTNRHLTIIYGLSRPLYSWLSRSFPFAYIFNLQSDQEIVRWLYLNRFEVSKQDDLTRLFKALETINQLKSIDPNFYPNISFLDKGLLGGKQFLVGIIARSAKISNISAQYGVISTNIRLPD